MIARTRFLTLLALFFVALWGLVPNGVAEDEAPKTIKAYCLDFNWAGRRGFAPPGTWKDADPNAQVAWHKAMGCNVIQTFCVSSNGYAWYKNGVVPEQPGLKHDFLREVVKLGHAEGMMVMGYFCIGANTRWGEENPELSYGTPSTYHIPYTDEYLAYLSAAISDAVKTTGIDGFMIDWVWMPKRQSTKGKWIAAEKELYAQLMGEPFPGEDELTGKLEGQLDLGKPWGEEEFLSEDESESLVEIKDIQVNTEGDSLEVVVPAEMTNGNPEVLVIEWGNAR